MIGKNIRKKRLKKGISQTELAKKVGVSRKTINRLERNPQYRPRLLLLEKIADALEVTIADLATNMEAQ